MFPHHPLVVLCSFLVISFIVIHSNAQQVNVTIFTESQCPYCTRLLNNHVLPMTKNRPGVMNLQIVPFGKGNCQFDYQQNIFCNCMHGPTECDLNRLQNCIISYFPKRHLGLFVCVQGLSNLREAFERCIHRLPPITQQRLIECASTQRGEFLNYHSMLNTHRASVRIWPTVFVNGIYFDHSFGGFEERVCRETYLCNTPPVGQHQLQQVHQQHPLQQQIFYQPQPQQSVAQPQRQQLVSSNRHPFQRRQQQQYQQTQAVQYQPQYAQQQQPQPYVQQQRPFAQPQQFSPQSQLQYQLLPDLQQQLPVFFG